MPDLDTIRREVLRILREKGPMGWYRLEHALMFRGVSSGGKLMELLRGMVKDGSILDRSDELDPKDSSRGLYAVEQ